MKHVVVRTFQVIVVLSILAVVFGCAPVPAQAECPAGDLYCPGWTPAQEEQKARLGGMQAQLLDPYYASFVANCDDVTVLPKFNGTTCIKNYNAASRGVLFALADKNKLPRDLTVLYAMVINDLWGRRNQASFNGNAEHDAIVWQRHFYWGFVDLATRLDLNPPLQLVSEDERVWCVKEEYGGVCPGKWD